MKGLVSIKKQVFVKIEEIIVLESIEDFKIEYNEDGSRKINITINILRSYLTPNSTYHIEYAYYMNNFLKHGIDFLSTSPPLPTNFKLLLSRESGFYINLVHIRKSEIHQNGVFATKFIPKDTLITFFPVDIIKMYFGTKSFNILNPDINNDTDFKHLDYSLVLNDKCKLIGSPKLTSNTAYIGHIINDGYKYVGNADKYMKKSIKLANVKYEIFDIDCPRFIPIIAIRDINAGEELLMTYGLQRWSSLW